MYVKKPVGFWKTDVKPPGACCACRKIALGMPDRIAFARDCTFTSVEVLKISLQTPHDDETASKQKGTDKKTYPLYGRPFKGAPETLFAFG